MLIVVAYDVTNDTRRTRLHTLLLGYGEPVQESIFECELTTREYRILRQRVNRTVDHTVDKIRYYPLCQECVEKIWAGTAPAQRPATVVLIV